MPNIKSAKKQMKQDVRRTKENKHYELEITNVFHDAKKGIKTKKDDFISKAYSVIDKASKKKVVHKHKASRLKRNISRLVHTSS